ncbi:MAG: hypothetical protein NZM42_11285, partial [Gemmatales bacterium]|nr:hypothetical protein [Gemmatales bacterium]
RVFRWDGKEWRRYERVEVQGGFVFSLDMVTPNDGWAVGYHDAGRYVIWRWDGTHWREFQDARLGLESIAKV